MTDFANYLEQASAPVSSRSGKYLQRLTDAEWTDVEAFGAWLEADGMGAASVASYRSYIAQAMCAAHDDIAFETLSSSVRSACKKFAEFKAS
jgi:hypothetical protein